MKKLFIIFGTVLTINFQLLNVNCVAQVLPIQTTNELKTKSLIALYDSIYYWRLDTSTMAWNVYDKAINFVYDANNNETSYINQSWNDTVWLNQAQLTSTFDINNNKTSQINQTWNGSVWVNNSQTTFTYDTNNNQISQLRQAWNSGTWVNAILFSYTYDSNNNRTIFLNQYWSGSTWINQFLYTCTFNINNKMTSGLSQHWNNTAWINSSQNTYTYNINNYMTSALNQSWSSGNWVTNNQTIYTYDVNNNNTNILSQNWNDTTWVNSTQWNYTYDINNFLKTQVAVNFNSTGIKVTQGDSAVYYFHVVAGVNELIIQPEIINIYPNPAINNITIESPQQEEIKILNIHGQLMKTIATRNNKTSIDISVFPSGMYVAKVKTEKGLAVKKFVKK